MLTTLVRALMFIICLGAASFAHADTYQLDSGLTLPANVTQHIGESAKFDSLFAQTHTELAKVPSETADGSLIWDFSKSPDPQPLEKHSTQSRSYDPALTSSSRMANLLRHDPEEVQPLYQLAIELPIEPVPCLTKGYSVDLCESLNWMLNTNPPSSRVSGWKESNLTFTTYQHRLIRA
ncbi:hypothetical protein MD588_06880 [Photobacterium sp. SDRW27]|uniref:hypothetical protein n=1 Tax=Photobacterium obscurum TaxID=2829490 RepID=UPI0022437A93|nr:hypothetical protein [Photobacterium obscurum]MCW8328528.1 hypothetical protein [Photobacterium obscurum]